MGVTQRLGTIPLAIQTDSSNNIGIGGSPSGSYKFEVTGTARVSGLLTGANATFGSTGTGNNIIALSNNDQSNTRLRITNTGSGGQTFSIVGGNPGASNAGLAIFDETNSATRLYISSAGNVGIGTSSPWGKFNVVDGTNKSFVVQDAGIADTIELINYSSGGGLRNISLTASTLIFNTGNAGGGTATERMRIKSNGQVEIGGDGLNGRLGIFFGGASRVGLDMRDVDDAVNATIQFYRNASGTGIGSITRAGGTNSVQFNTSSDYRLKEDLKEVNGIQKVSAIKIYDFKWKGTESRMDGVLAHELAEILPYAVHGEKDGEEMQGVDYSKIVPVLVKAIQELNAKVTALENK